MSLCLSTISWIFFGNPVFQLCDLIETWGFCEDLKPIVLHHEEDDNDDIDDDNDDNNDKNKFKFLSFGTW